MRNLRYNQTNAYPIIACVGNVRPSSSRREKCPRPEESDREREEEVAQNAEQEDIGARVHRCNRPRVLSPYFFFFFFSVGEGWRWVFRFITFLLAGCVCMRPGIGLTMVKSAYLDKRWKEKAPLSN